MQLVLGLLLQEGLVQAADTVGSEGSLWLHPDGSGHLSASNTESLLKGTEGSWFGGKDMCSSYLPVGLFTWVSILCFDFYKVSMSAWILHYLRLLAWRSVSGQAVRLVSSGFVKVIRAVSRCWQIRGLLGFWNFLICGVLNIYHCVHQHIPAPKCIPVYQLWAKAMGRAWHVGKDAEEGAGELPHVWACVPRPAGQFSHLWNHRVCSCNLRSPF